MIHDMNSGYSGYRMSKRAVEAYANNERPKSKWTKADMIDAVALAVEGENTQFNPNTLSRYSKDTLFSVFFCYSSWHHTGSYCNATDFYELVDEDALLNITEQELIDIEERIKEEKKAAKARKKKEEENPEVWLCEYLVWGGSRNHPVAEEHTAAGIIRGNWLFTNDGKKKTDSKGFRMLQKGVVIDDNVEEYYVITTWDYTKNKYVESYAAQIRKEKLVQIRYKEFRSDKKTKYGYLLKTEVCEHPETWFKCPKCGMYYQAEIAKKGKCLENRK